MDSAKIGIKAELKRTEKVISKRLYGLRLKQGLTQEAIAAAVGLPYQAIGRYEKGQTPITAGKLYRIAIYMNVPITSFFLEDHSEAVQIRLPGI